MLFRKSIVATRTFFKIAVAAAFSIAAAGTASAAGAPGPTTPPLLVPYTINTIAGTPQYSPGTTTSQSGYFGEGVPATTSLANKTGAGILLTPWAIAVDSVGNVYITDQGNFLIREVNAQTGAINTIAGIVPKGCSGAACSLRTSGCADGVPAIGAALGTHLEGIAVDAYGNVYFVDNTTSTVSVVYRGGTQVANFIALVNPGGAAKSGGVQQGYVYHIAGQINLSTCSAVVGNQDNGIAFSDTSSSSAPAFNAQLHGPTMVTLDSAGNIYISDISNSTTRVINTQATTQTFFQYAVAPGFMRSITDCNAALTIGCPTAPTTQTANTGIAGPANALVFNSQFKASEADAYGNVYQLNGTGSGTGQPGIYAPVAYAGGAPVTNLLTVNASFLNATYPGLNTLTYGNAYIAMGDPNIATKLATLNVDVLEYSDGGSFDVRPSYFIPDTFGTYWFLDNHYPEFNRVDQYTGLGTLMIRGGGRATANISPLNTSPASFSNPYYCVYGSTSAKLAFTQGPQTYDPQGDGCPVNVATFTGGTFQTTFDGVGNIYVGDSGEQIERIINIGNYFPATNVGTAVTQPIQVHFNSKNPPQTGNSVPAVTAVAVTTTAFSIAPGISDFVIDTTDPEFPMGSLIGGGAYGLNSTTANFALYPVAGQQGLPTCAQLGAQPIATGVLDYDCLVYVTFTPTAPGARQSQLQVTTANGGIFYFSLNGVGTGGQLAIDGGSAATVPITGLGTSGSSKIGGIAVTQSGTLLVADPANNRIVVVPSGGTQSNLTFTGVTPSTLSGPMGVAVDSSSNVYVADTGNNRILKITPPITGTGPGVATTLGNNSWIAGTSGNSSSAGVAAVTTTTTPPAQYAFNAPQALAVDKWNNVYVADTGNKAVVEITSNIALGGAVPLLNYPGAPKFVNPVGIAVDSIGNVYVADTGNSTAQIVKLGPGGGDLVTLSGSQFPNVIGSALQVPAGVAVDAAGNVYVSDIGSNSVIEIPSSSGPGSSQFAINLTTINAAGTGLTTLSSPGGLALDANGNLYVADTGNQQVLFDNRQSPLIQFGNSPEDMIAQPICPGTMLVDGYNIGNSSSCVLTISNIGNAPVVLLPAITSAVGNKNAAFSTTDNCSATVGATLAPGLTCNITATFNPTATNGQNQNVSVNGTQTLNLVANGAQPLANIVLTAVYSGGAPTANGTATITATVTQPHITNNTPTGTVTFTYAIDTKNNNINNCGSGGTQTVNLVNGVATFTLPTLLQGLDYTVSANYNGDSLNSAAAATPIDVVVPPINVSPTVTSTAAQLTFTYGGTPPVPVGTYSTLPAGLTAVFGSAATKTSPISSATHKYPVTLSFSGAGACAYGFPVVNYSTGGQAFVTINPAALTYVIPNFTSQYGAMNISYGANAVITGAVNGDKFGATFTPAQSSILNVGTYSVVPTVTGANASNYTVTANPSTLTITPAPTAMSVSAAKTAVLNTTSGVASAVYTISVATAVGGGRGVPTGTVTVSDVFTPITSTGYGTPAAPATTVVTLAGGVTTYTPTNTAAGLHQYSFVYSGDSNFQATSVAPAPNSVACTANAVTVNCLVVDYADFFLSSNTGPVAIIPGIVPSGNGLLSAPNQSTAAPETAVMFVTAVNGFTGTVNLTCQTQNPSYVNCFMTPISVCFAASSSLACTNTATTAASVLAISTPATLPLGFKTSQVQTSASKTVLAFIPFGVLAFCVRRRKRLSNALWMLIGIVAIGAGMTGCGGNQVAFYTPIPTGPQTVTVTATATVNATTYTRQFVVPINVD